MPSSVQKRLNRSICCLGCGLRWTKGSKSSIAFDRWCQCALMEGHEGTMVAPGEYDWCGDAASCQITLTTGCYY